MVKDIILIVFFMIIFIFIVYKFYKFSRRLDENNTYIDKIYEIQCDLVKENYINKFTNDQINATGKIDTNFKIVFMEYLRSKNRLTRDLEIDLNVLFLYNDLNDKDIEYLSNIFYDTKGK